MNAPKKTTLDFWNKIDAQAAAYGLFAKNRGFLLGVSGGPDSMALLHYFLKRRSKEKMAVCHLNHGIRGAAADGDEAFVRKFCAVNGIKFFTARRDIPFIAGKTGRTVEQAARSERYSFFAETALREKFSHICTAHHSDDNAETFLLNLLRGTRAAGLKGIPVKRKISAKLIIIRPLLSCSKKEILAYLKANGVRYRKDATNEEDKYTRNWIRKRLLPIIEKKQPKFREHLVRICGEMNEILT